MAVKTGLQVLCLRVLMHLGRRELTHMLHIHRKAEVEVLASVRESSPGAQDALVKYVLDKIASRCERLEDFEWA